MKMAFYICYNNGTATITSMYSDVFKIADIGKMKHEKDYWGDRYEMAVAASDAEEAKNIFYKALAEYKEAQKK